MINPNNLHVLLGMPRAGTTFLYHKLSKHPNIVVPFRRKTNYFAAHTGKPESWFLGHFEGENWEDNIGLDTDTLSFLNDKAYDKFFEYYKDKASRVILVVRDPASWSYSLYKQIKSFNFKMPSFRSYLEDGYNLVEDGADVPYKFTDGAIQKKLENIQKNFAGRLLLVDYGFLKTNPLEVINEMEKFLEIENFYNSGNFENEIINAGSRKTSIFLNKLLRQNWLIWIVNTLFPRKFVIWLRQKYDKLSAKIKKNPRQKTSKSEKISENDTDKATALEFAKNFYKSDTLYVKGLFKSKQIIWC